MLIASRISICRKCKFTEALIKNTCVQKVDFKKFDVQCNFVT